MTKFKRDISGLTCIKMWRNFWKGVTYAKLKKAKIPIQMMPVNNYLFEIIGTDTCGPFPESAQRNKHVITVVGHFSSWPEACLTSDKSAESVSKILMKHVFPRHSCPWVMLSDRGTWGY